MKTEEEFLADHHGVTFYSEEQIGVVPQSKFSRYQARKTIAEYNYDNISDIQVMTQYVYWGEIDEDNREYLLDLEVIEDDQTHAWWLTTDRSKGGFKVWAQVI